jgi:hypothetical protein
MLQNISCVIPVMSTSMGDFQVVPYVRHYYSICTRPASQPHFHESNYLSGVLRVTRMHRPRGIIECFRIGKICDIASSAPCEMCILAANVILALIPPGRHCMSMHWPRNLHKASRNQSPTLTALPIEDRPVIYSINSDFLAASKHIQMLKSQWNVFRHAMFNVYGSRCCA